MEAGGEGWGWGQVVKQPLRNDLDWHRKGLHAFKKNFVITGRGGGGKIMEQTDLMETSPYHLKIKQM